RHPRGIAAPSGCGRGGRGREPPPGAGARRGPGAHPERGSPEMKSLVPMLGLALLLSMASASLAQEEVKGTFAAPVDRAWSVVETVLRQLGWEIENADRSIGWITTKSRSLEGEDYGVYAKGTRHRLRVIAKDAGSGRTAVTVERTVFKRERILF